MSFATYASQFLNRPQASSSSARPASSASTTQPLFFSFTTDEASVQLDDANDPHFRKYDSAELRGKEDDEEDPYLRLDDEDGPEEYGSKQYPVEEDDDDEGAGVGWLAHQRSPSPPYTRSPPQPQRTVSPNARNYPRPMPSPSPSEPQPQSLSLALSESLLPRTGAEAHAFNLPAPHTHPARGRRKPQPNARAAAAFLFAYTVLCVLSLLSLVLPSANTPSERPPPALLHTIPLLTFLTLLSALLSYIHLALLRAFLRPVLLLSALAPPLALFLSSVLAFAGSFSSGAGWGLRLFALIPLALAVLSVRRLPAELHRAARSPALLSLSTRILFFRAPLLLILSPLILLAGLILSLPLLTLLVRLPLFHSWYMQLSAAAIGICSLHVYFVARAVQRSMVAGGVGAWYFTHSVSAPSSGGWNTGYAELDAQLLTLHAALHRPLGPLVLSALVSLLLSGLSFLQLVLFYLPLALPYRVIAIFADTALARVHALGERIGGGRYTGVYCGLTGASFWEGARGIRELRATAPERALPALPLPRPYTLALPFALVAYLRAAGDREGEEGISYADQQRAAVGAAILAGAVCAAVAVFCAGVVRDCADTLYVCHLIDRAVGTEGRDNERQEVWSAFDPAPADAPRDAEAALGLNFGGFNFGGLGFGLGGAGGGPGAEVSSERGGRGEEPVYARLRRTSEEENRKVPPPPPLQPRGRERGFKAPGGEGAAAPQRDWRPPLAASASASMVKPQMHLEPEEESDVDSLDSRSGGGGESSGAFPGSGFF
ncbi:hypothetical protein B0H15DRAFT_796909 [Mycena belliarum]|uniref:Protein PNS1 n=1 Tax=Mycena belliarum TaxID=1033014 RepID=A0AAD6UEE0_9AGAR|nr:hypothetical protein B0H15DRAFT_796909 [Mycena belliae]